jgi:hypothetical protein
MATPLWAHTAHMHARIRGIHLQDTLITMHRHCYLAYYPASGSAACIWTPWGAVPGRGLAQAPPRPQATVLWRWLGAYAASTEHLHAATHATEATLKGLRLQCHSDYIARTRWHAVMLMHGAYGSRLVMRLRTQAATCMIHSYEATEQLLQGYRW